MIKLALPLVLAWISGAVTVVSFWTTIISGLAGIGFGMAGFVSIFNIAIWVLIISFILTIVFFVWFIATVDKSEKDFREDIMKKYGE